jgi:hypothetical protein
MLLDIATGAIGITAGRQIEVWTQMTWATCYNKLKVIPHVVPMHFVQLAHCAQVRSSQQASL